MKHSVKFLLFVLHVFCFSNVVCAQKAESLKPWTWIFTKNFSNKELAKNKNKKSIAFSKRNLKPFSQLIFSWNVFRPKKGHFTFWVQVRDIKSKQWGKWHKMADWGKGVQRSHYSRMGPFAEYRYVRLEMKHKGFADAFRVKVATNDQAPLDLVKAFSVSLSNLRAFASEKAEKYINEVSSVRVARVPTVSQRGLDHPSDKLCGPASCSMLTSYFSKKKVCPVDFAKNAFDSGLGMYGSWPFNMAHAFEQCEGNVLFTVGRLPTFAHLYQKLQRGVPVVVSVRGMLKGAPKKYEHHEGHLLVVVGFDAKKGEIICHDPAWFTNEQTVYRYPLDNFLKTWEASRRLAYIAEPIKRG